MAPTSKITNCVGYIKEKINKRRLKICILIILSLFINKLLGTTLGILGNCRTKHDHVNKVIYYTNCKGITKHVINNTLGAEAIALDHVILTPSLSLSPNTYKHELAHTKQYSILGPSFLPLYGIAYMVATVDSKINGYQNIHAGNIFEIWANKSAGLPTEPKIYQ